MIGDRNYGQSFVRQGWLGAREVEEDAVRILQVIGFHLKVAVSLDRDARYRAQGPKSDSGDVMRFSNVGRNRAASNQNQQRAGAPPGSRFMLHPGEV